MQTGIQRGALNVDKGMNTKKFLLSVCAALIVFFVCIALWSIWSAHSAHPTLHDNGHAGDGVTATEKGGTGR